MVTSDETVHARKRNEFVDILLRNTSVSIEIGSFNACVGSIETALFE